MEPTNFIAATPEAERLLRTLNMYGKEAMLRELGDRPTGEGFSVLVALVALLAERANRNEFPPD